MSSARVPFPVKVLISYLVVVFAGAAPILLYLGQRFTHEMTAYAANNIVEHARLVAQVVTPLGPAERAQQLRAIANTSLERFTYIDATGRVIYDSRVANALVMDNHRDREEVRLALGDTIARQPFDPGLGGVGVAKRLSDTTGEQSLYAAAVLPPLDAKSLPEVVRLSLPMEQVVSLTAALEVVFRNSLALSVSAAILLSLIAALVFMRPLQRVVVAARALAEGDYTAVPSGMGNDEVGDVGRSLKQLGIELRRRLAHAEAGSAMMRQLVWTLTVPLALFDPDGAPVAINGPARELLGAVGEAEDERLDAFVTAEAVAVAFRKCVESGRPEKVKVAIMADETEVRGWVAALERPERPPFIMFMGQAAYRPAGSRLPKPSSVRVVQLADVVTAGIARAGVTLAAEGLRPPEVGEIPRAWVADAYGRLAMAVSLACEESVRQRAKAGLSTPLEFIMNGPAVGIALPGGLGSEAVANLRMLLEPLGGEVRVDASRAEIYLVRA